MNNMIKPIIANFRFTNNIMNTILPDISSEQANTRLRDTEGATIAWSIGHLIDYRHQVMNMFGSTIERDFEETFCKKGASDGSDYPDIKALKEKWDSLINGFEEVLNQVTDEQLQAPVNKEAMHDERTLLDVIAFYNWHEAYHMGVVGAIRKKLGLKSTSDLVIEAMEK